MSKDGIVVVLALATTLDVWLVLTLVDYIFGSNKKEENDD